jgi:uncharacterized protein YjbJ (UPF0337 family)
VNKDHVLGLAKSIAGLFKEAAGRAIGDRKTAADGLALRLAGRAQMALGSTRQTIRRLGR